MSSLQTEGLMLWLTPPERILIEGLANTREMTASDLLRELIGLEREEQSQPAPQRLRPYGERVAGPR